MCVSYGNSLSNLVITPFWFFTKYGCTKITVPIAQKPWVFCLLLFFFFAFPLTKRCVGKRQHPSMFGLINKHSKILTEKRLCVFEFLMTIECYRWVVQSLATVKERVRFCFWGKTIVAFLQHFWTVLEVSSWYSIPLYSILFF